MATAFHTDNAETAALEGVRVGADGIPEFPALTDAQWVEIIERDDAERRALPESLDEEFDVWREAMTLFADSLDEYDARDLAEYALR